jgi:uncharacterized membrane protein
MASLIKHIPDKKTNQALRWASIILAIIGAADSLYLWIYKISSNDKMCLGSGDCATVNYSVYSEIYGIPVALLGLFVYAVFIIVLALEPYWKTANDIGPYFIFGGSFVGVLFSAYLTYIEFFVIFAVCPFCVISAIAITLLFILAIIRLVKHIS